MTAPDPEPRRAADIAEAEKRRLWRMAGMGGTLASEILAGALLGWIGDHFFDTKPTLIIVMTIAGVAVGMAHFIRSALSANRSGASTGLDVAARHPEIGADDPEWKDGEDDPR